MKEEIYVVFGSNEQIRQSKHIVKNYSFSTKEELNAFILGIQEAVRWNGNDIHLAGSIKCAADFVDLVQSSK